MSQKNVPNETSSVCFSRVCLLLRTLNNSRELRSYSFLSYLQGLNSSKLIPVTYWASEDNDMLVQLDVASDIQAQKQRIKKYENIISSGKIPFWHLEFDAIFSR